MSKKQMRSARIAEQIVERKGADIIAGIAKLIEQGADPIDAVVHYASRQELEIEAVAGSWPPIRH